MLVEQRVRARIHSSLPFPLQNVMELRPIGVNREEPNKEKRKREGKNCSLGSRSKPILAPLFLVTKQNVVIMGGTLATNHKASNFERKP